MILNPETIQNKRGFKKNAAYWLMYQGHVPLLSLDGETYWFAVSDLLEEALKHMPLLTKYFDFMW